MKNIYKEYLFDKHILVNDTGKDEKNAFSSIFALANKLGIEITEGYELATLEVFNFAATSIGMFIPEPFYRGFPETVRKLSTEEKLFDQLYHYFNTYRLGNFEEPGHSVFEQDFERAAFQEGYTKSSFIIVEETVAEVKLKEFCSDLVKSTRPLSCSQFDMLAEYMKDYSYSPTEFASKDTVIRLIVNTKDMTLAKYLALSDVIKILDYILSLGYDVCDIGKINLKNSDRKFITSVINEIFKIGYVNVRECFEKRKIWVGLLHHLHYKPGTDAEEEFVSAIRGGKNQSVYSKFEAAIAANDICRAADIILSGKGQSALLRNLNYLLSRAVSDSDVEYVLKKVNSKNAILLIQLLTQYANYAADDARTFKFAKHGRLVHHEEDEYEQGHRKSRLDESLIIRIRKIILRKLEETLSCKLGKVYIDSDMKNIALPLNEGTSIGGYGALPCGSRIKIPESKKLRAFTYWEQVNDVDLSIIGIDDEGNQTEFSWRTMFKENEDAIVFSGDQTSGYEGGSEYFDIYPEAFCKKFKNLKYLICANNVYSQLPFAEFFCKAGYMTRDTEDSGEIFEPKTVKSSFRITADSTTAYLFAIDIKSRDFIWLNIADKSMRQIAGTERLAFFKSYMNITDVINLENLFVMLAERVVSDPEDADVIVSDKESDFVVGKEIIRSFDFEKILTLLN